MRVKPSRWGSRLFVLESTQARAAHEALVQQRLSLLAKKARLDSEKAGETRIWLPPELRSTDPQIRSIVEAQQEVFETRRSTYASKRDILAQRVEQLQQQIKGYEAQVEATSRQIDFVGEELGAKEYLVRRGLVPKPEALRLRRTDAEISGKRGEYVAEIARARQQIGEAKLQILAVDVERADQIAADAEKVRFDLDGGEREAAGKRRRREAHSRGGTRERHRGRHQVQDDRRSGSARRPHHEHSARR